MPTADFWEDVPEPGSGQKRIMNAEKPDSPDDDSKRGWKLILTRMSRLGRTLVVPVLVFGFMLLGALAGLTLWGWQTLATAAETGGDQPLIVEIIPGTSTLDILTRLEEEGLLLSKWPALGYILARGQVLRAGVYTFTPALTGQEIVNRIIDGNVTEYRVTIPEGWRVEQIGQLLASMEIVDAAEFRLAAMYDSVRYTLPAGMTLSPGSTLEGLLFPDTYQFRLGVTSKEIVKIMLENFSKRVTDLTPNYADVVLASIIEREAGSDEERAAIAGVYRNRLDANLRLDADPTVQYAKESKSQAVSDDSDVTWWKPVAVEDYQQVVSPYNTYRETGLPPTPIANPGRASLEAVLRPDEHDFFYFFHTETGASIFSKSLEEHNEQRRIHSLEMSP